MKNKSVIRHILIKQEPVFLLDFVNVLSGHYDGITVHMNKKMVSPVSDCGLFLFIHLNDLETLSAYSGVV